MLEADLEARPFVHEPLSARSQSIPANPSAAPWSLSWVNTPGVLILACGFVEGWCRAASRLGDMARVGGDDPTDVRLRHDALRPGLCQGHGYSGMIASASAAFFVGTLGTLHSARRAHPGAPGSFVTGSAIPPPMAPSRSRPPHRRCRPLLAVRGTPSACPPLAPEHRQWHRRQGLRSASDGEVSAGRSG